MKILITGAAGFLGSHILKNLIKEKHTVIALTLSSADNSRISKELKKIKHYNSDKCSLERIFSENKNIGCVIHAATLYGRNNESVHEIFDTNTHLPLKLLSLTVKNKVKLFINTDTNLPYNAHGKMRDYVMSKKQFLEWSVLCAQTQTAFVNVIPEYMYGAFDDMTKFLPFVINKCVSDAKKLDLTNGGQKRDFIYVEDIACAYEKIARNKHKGFTEYQIGTGKTKSLKNAVLTISKLTKSSTKLNFGAIPYRKDDKMFSKANIKNILSLGWKPKYSFEDGIKKIISLQYPGRHK
jgi:Nucleoside-diphosphate-sugar epimerases